MYNNFSELHISGYIVNIPLQVKGKQVFMYNWCTRFEGWEDLEVFTLASFPDTGGTVISIK